MSSTNAILCLSQSNIRRTTDFSKPMNGTALPNMLAAATMTNVGPLAIYNNSGATTGAQLQVVEAVGAYGNAAYLGMNLKGSVAIGDAVSPQKNVIVDGFFNCSAGSPVYIDPSANASSGTQTTGLTHNQSSGYIAVGLAVGPTKIYFY